MRGASPEASYFVRHTETLGVRREDLEALWEADRIAVHYPGDTSAGPDSESTDSEDYERRQDRSAIKTLSELAYRGGYVWAQSYAAPSGEAKVGYVTGAKDGGAGVELERGARWRIPGGHPGRQSGDPAVLKTLRLEAASVKLIGKGEAMDLRAARPRQGTIVRWRSCGPRLRALVEGTALPMKWSSLSPAQQEAACAEFLRERHPARPDLPVLRRLLLPVGRTLEDVDLYGLAESGERIYAQVTHLAGNEAGSGGKVARLAEYAAVRTGARGGAGRARTVFFCSSPTPTDPGDATFVSADEEVLPWILASPAHREALFGTRH